MGSGDDSIFIWLRSPDTLVASCDSALAGRCAALRSVQFGHHGQIVEPVPLAGPVLVTSDY